MRKFLFQTSRGTVFALFACILLWLFFLAGFSTSAMNFFERTYLIGDNIWWNLLFVSGCILLMRCMGKIPIVQRFVTSVNT
ncbi:MAG: hypothetical protein IJU98_11550, partial [Synergistaceae bacterium]|nr:hypothetical protein [Synergistaceae bacterium]